MERKIIVWLIFLWHLSWRVIAQNIDYTATFQQLELRLQKGDKKALKDLGSLLNDHRTYQRIEGKSLTLHQKSIELLQQYTLITSQMFLFNPLTTRQAFLKFYYQQESQWKFSEFLQVFFLDSLYKQPYKYRLSIYRPLEMNNQQVLFKHYKREFLHVIDLQLYNQVPEILERIAQLKYAKSFLLLKQCIEGKYWKTFPTNTFAARLYEATCYALRHYASLESVHLILKVMQQEKTYHEGALEALSYITNIHPRSLSRDITNIVSAYQQLLTRYPNIDQLREYGYRQLFDYQKIHFQQPVDYYGTILNKSYTRFWIKYNAVQDLRKLHDARVLWYLAAQVFQQKGKLRYNWQADIDPLKILKEITGAEVEVPNAIGEWSSNLTDRVAKLNFVQYWQQHYKDYKWEEAKQQFVNRKVPITEGKHQADFDKYFKRLHRQDQKVALNAFQQLANYQAKSVLQALPKQKMIVFPQSYQLPIYPYLSLEVLIRLRDFCKQNALDYLPYQKEILIKLLPLEQRTTFKERLKSERLLLKSLTLQNITALEYWAIVRENSSWRLGYSLGNILSRFYASKKVELFRTPMYLRLYLKKCALFGKLRPQGLGAEYDALFRNLTLHEQQILDSLWDQEKDKDVRLKIAQLSKKPLFKLHKGFTQFVLNPHARQWQKARKVEIFHPKDFQVIINQIKQLQHPEKIQWLLYWLKQQNSVESVPYLMELIDNQKIIGKHRGFKQPIPLTVSDEVVFILEQIYKHSFMDEKDFYKVKPKNLYRFSKNISYWKLKWSKQKQHYKHWAKDFFDRKLLNIQTKAQVGVNLLNNILLSTYYRDSTMRQVVLEALPKIHPVSDIIYLQWKSFITLAELKYFEKGFTYQLFLSNIIPSIQTSPTELLKFVQKVVMKLPEHSQGKLFYDLGRKTDLWHWLYTIPGSSLRSQVIVALQAYQNTQTDYRVRQEIKGRLILLRNEQLMLKEIVSKIKKLNDEVLQQETLHQLIFQTRYQHVLDLIDNIARLKSISKNPDAIHTKVRQHLKYNLGLPLDSNQPWFLVKKEIQNTTQLGLFEKYLRNWYPDLIERTQALDYSYMIDVLRQARALPLVGVGRDDTRVYVLLCFFELTFQTHLGYPPNMYNAQSWDKKISIAQWKSAWISFLKSRMTITKKKKEKYK